MNNNIITNKELHDMLLMGGHSLQNKVNELNALNVFPVPDGDTGSNMNMTFQAGAAALEKSQAKTVSELSRDFSKGLLMGARGNSGVILSQYFRGIAEGLEGLDVATTEQFYSALEKAVERSYASVVKAVEGTILTVGREMVENTKCEDTDFITFFENLVSNGQVSLDNTPNILPILKEAGVVDSGGAGILCVFEGMLASLKGEEIKVELSYEALLENDIHDMDPEDIIFGYCTEVLLNIEQVAGFSVNDIREKLNDFGDSIVCIQDEEILKVHVHTETPTKLFDYIESFGTFIHIKSENMRIQAINAQTSRKSSRKEIGIVAIASSDQMGELFNKYHDVQIISGGQTLNPSIEDISRAIENANADNVIVLPNNSNIIMAANAAKDIVEGVNIEIIPTKYMTQAIECLVHFNPELEFDINVQAMNESIKELVNFEITTAIKDTSIEGVEIKANDYLGIKNGKIVYSMPNVEDLLKNIADDLIKLDCEHITILCGADGDESFITSISEYIENECAFTEIEIHDTNQPVYSYLLAGV
jgi:DAK2 domain fusion protein YloV